ncbi:uncharacterized protein E5676_scaffold203G00030 [Cucumis melo var. makuwa]|uniref:Uncharacterized protein n=1 Tax=Cucumis melo var. makuwa TaxID=1194695 RepID=A0A5D3BHW9_CUCMM|nr:uncharacterized protein E5676_scaffold203G00030 [Cucumis melo var. makuwa]
MEKNAYMGHMKYLPRYHPYRIQKKNFDGKKEHENPPQPLSGEAIYFKLKEIIFSCGKKCGTLLDIPGKSKDGMNTRLDLVEMNIRPELAPMVSGNNTYIPAACYTLSREEKYRFCKTLSKVKVPEGYLYTCIESSRTLNLHKFVDAGSISCGSSKEERAQLLTARLLGTDYCPKQLGVVECGYYVMKFMRDIILSTSTSIIHIMKDLPRAYTQDDIDCIRSEWAEFVGEHVHCA